jgi:hypothetical protein
MIFMAQVIAQKKVERNNESEMVVLTAVRARMMTVGGTVILAITIILSLVLIFTLLYPQGNGLQFVIIIALAMISWGFFLNCVTEKLKLEDGFLIFSSLVGRTVRLDLTQVDSYKLTTFGLRLDGNMYLIEVEHEDSEEPEEIWLSPCWEKQDLVRFCKTLGLALEEVNQ